MSASLGQALLARRARAVAIEKKPLLDDLRRILLAYLQPVLEPPVTTSNSDTKAPPKAATKKR